MKINVPEEVKTIIKRLNSQGFSAYVVGGCVRDSILNRKPQDWDISSSAKPEQVKEIFYDMGVIETGIKHGTVSVIINHNPYEVTTFRCDGEYKDNRRPDTVTFVSGNDDKKQSFGTEPTTYNTWNVDQGGKIEFEFKGKVNGISAEWANKQELFTIAYTIEPGEIYGPNPKG